MVDHFAEPARAAGPRWQSRDASVLAAASGLVAVTAAVAIDPATVDDGPVLCPFRLLTGLPCPGCGLTRSWVHLAHGQWDEAIAVNPFGAVSMLAVLAFVVAVAVALVRRTPMPDLGRLVTSRWVLGVGAVWIAYGVGRLLLHLVR